MDDKDLLIVRLRAEIERLKQALDDAADRLAADIDPDVVVAEINEALQSDEAPE